MRRIGAALSAVLVVIAVGAWHLAENAHSFTDDLDGWVQDAEANLKKVDDGPEVAVDFRVPTPLSLDELNKHDRLGKVDGMEIEESEGALEKAGLSDEQARHLGCFLTTKAVNGELSLEPPEVEEEIYDYATEEVFEPPPELEIRDELGHLRDAIEGADTDGEGAFRGAMDFACAVLEHDELFE
jgi:hypothetical protein